MMNFIEILAVQRPFPIGRDSNSREQFACNYNAWAVDADGWEESLAALISGAGLGTLNTSLFIGPDAVIPAGTGPYVTITDTGGRPPQETHNGGRYARLSAQVLVRGTYAAARTRALAIWRTLDGVRGVSA